jgi:arginyl-tRNA synthetase
VIKNYIEEQLLRSLADWPDVPAEFEIELEIPNNTDHGDLATNTALRLARHLRKAPRKIAEEIRDRLLELPLDPDRIAAIEVAGSGFLNFRYASSYLYRELQSLLDEGSSFGRADRRGKTAIVEFVSANPTGPLTIGHGRNAVLGDTIANLLEWSGYDVTREYYYNDAGRQMRVLGESVRARFEELVDPDIPRKDIEGAGAERVSVPISFPDDGYLGEYIIDIAGAAHEALGESGDPVPSVETLKHAAEKAIFGQIESTLARLGIRMDSHFNEHSLYENNAVWDVLKKLRDQGHVYDQDGAVWFRTSELGKEKDTVLVKSSGEPTYRLPDIAYHVDKLSRGFDLVVDIFGADHVAQYPDILSAIRLLGLDETRIHVVIYQFVTLVRGGEPVKMSTRKATYEMVDDLLDEVGEEVTRFFFLMRSPNTHLEFDLDLAKEASEKNPVFYLQYAHARICAILRKAEEVGFKFARDADLTLLDHPTQTDLIKTLLRFPDAIASSAADFEPHRLTVYLREVAVAFTQFYGNSRIIGEPEDIATARMHLARATQTVLANGLRILGIGAPERM